MQLTIGDVIRWDNYPYPKSGDPKARWFIYLGRTSIVFSPVFVYLCTTTTQTAEYEPGRKRAHHACRRFDVRMFPMFDKDCVLDFDEDIHPVTDAALDACLRDISVKGRLDKDTMRNIYKQYYRPGVVSPAVLRDICDSFNRDGITGLKRPK